MISNLLTLTREALSTHFEQLFEVGGQHPLLVPLIVLDQVHREDLLCLSLRHLRAVPVEKHSHVRFEEWLRRWGFFLDYELGDVWLRPEKGERASDLSIRVEFGAAGLILADDNLLELDEVGHEASLIDTTMQESSASALSPASRNQDQVNLTLDGLPIDEALHQVSAPALADALRLELLKQVAIPTEVLLDVILGIKAVLLVQGALALQV